AQEEFTVVSSSTVMQDAENDENNADKDIAAAGATGGGEPSMVSKILRALMCGC
ncbi:hypothetical protein BGX24_011568, partial [Mortierella sp. AD032]